MALRKTTNIYTKIQKHKFKTMKIKFCYVMVGTNFLNSFYRKNWMKGSLDSLIYVFILFLVVTVNELLK